MKKSKKNNVNDNLCDHTPPPPPSSVLGSLHLYFSVIYRHGKLMHDKAMKEFGITGQQIGYLKFINENPGISQEALAKHLHIDKGTVAKSVKVLIKKGMIDRKENPDDRRAYCLFPTRKAVIMHRRGEANSIEFERHVTNGLTEEEIATLGALLDKITDNIAEMLEGGKI